MMSRAMGRLLGVLVLSVACLGSSHGTLAQEATPVPVTGTTSALVVAPITAALIVPGSDGLDHIEYDLLFSNVFTGPVELTRIEAIGPDGAVLLDLQGDALTATTQPLIPAGPTNIVPFSGAVATVMDVRVPSGTAPASLTHRITYALAPDAQLPELIGSLTIAGPEVAVDPRAATVIQAPVESGRWLNVDGCCIAGTHRSFITSANGLHFQKPETFAIDWMGMDGTALFAGDGTKNSDYAGYGAAILSATAGTVIAVRDGNPEPQPNQAPFVDGPADFSGNSVVVQVSEGVYALYAHLIPGSVAVSVGDTVAAGDELGKLGNSGNTSAPHLHFQLMDGPEVLTASSLPFVIDDYRLVGQAEIAFVDGMVTVPRIAGTSSVQANTMPLDDTVIDIS